MENITLTKKQGLIAALTLIIIGYATAHFTQPERVIEKEKIVYKEQEHKEVAKDINKNVNKKKTTTIAKDGSKVIVEETNSNTQDKTLIQKDTTKELVKENSKETIYSEKNNALGLRLNTLGNGEVYGQAGMKCLMFRCYVEGSAGKSILNPNTTEVKGSVGIEFRF